MSKLKPGALGAMREIVRRAGYGPTAGAGWLQLARLCGASDEVVLGKGTARDWLAAKFDPAGKMQRHGRKPRRPAPPPKRVVPESREFLATYEWRKVRMQALTMYGARCMCCGASPRDGARMHVDHIKPRKLFPELALDVNNLQVLCEVCNHGKGNWDQTDWRK